VTTLQRLMVDTNSLYAMKGNAARSVIAMALKGVEVDDLEARIDELERAMLEQQKQR
jgi:hypothetical protein